MNVLVTGANRGIGLEFVRQLLERGDSVIATARQPDEAEALQALETSAQAEFYVLHLDVLRAESLEKVAGFVRERTLDVLINNAGVLLRAGALGELDYHKIAQCLDVNALGPLRVVEAVLPALRRSARGRIINVSSKMGSIEENSTGGAYAYRMSKAALNMATRSLALDLATDGITVLAVHPGWVQTRMGGSEALMDAPTSVSHMLRLIDGAKPDQSGKFLEWNGKPISW